MSLNNSNDFEKLAYSIGELAKKTSLSKTFLRNEISSGNLKVCRFGRRVLVLREDLKRYLNNKGETNEKRD